MDLATLKHSYGPWGHDDRWVYQPPFGDYVTRAMSGYGQEPSGMGTGFVSFAVGALVGFLVGQNVEREVTHRRYRRS